MTLGIVVLESSRLYLYQLAWDSMKTNADHLIVVSRVITPCK